MTLTHQYSAEGAVPTTMSQCDFRSLAYLKVSTFGPRFVLSTVLNTSSYIISIREPWEGWPQTKTDLETPLLRTDESILRFHLRTLVFRPM